MATSKSALDRGNGHSENQRLEIPPMTLEEIEQAGKPQTVVITAWNGMVGLGPAGVADQGVSRLGLAGQRRRGWAGRGRARLGGVWLGQAGTVRPVPVRHGGARQVEAGEAW